MTLQYGNSYKIIYKPIPRSFVARLKTITDELYRFVVLDEFSDFYVMKKEIGVVYEIEELTEIEKLLYNIT